MDLKERFVLVGKIDDTFYVLDKETNEVDPLSDKQINHALGLGLSIVGVHGISGVRGFNYTEENFVPLGIQSQGQNGLSHNDFSLDELRANLGLAPLSQDGDTGYDGDDGFADFDDDEDYIEDEDSETDTEDEVVEQDTSEASSDTDNFDEYDEDDSWGDEDYVDEDSSESDNYDNDEEEEEADEEEEEFEEEAEDEVEEDYGWDDWDDDDDDDWMVEKSAFAQLMESLTPDEKNVLAEYYMLRSRLSFDETINPSASNKSAFNITRVSVDPKKKAKLDEFRQPNKSWAYAGFIDMCALGYGGGYCTFGHALRYKHIVININKIGYGDILKTCDPNLEFDRYSNAGITFDSAINLDVIREGAESGDIIEFGVKCLADFFEVSPAVMSYIRHVQTQSLSEMEELNAYYEAEKTTPGTVQKAMDSFKFFDELMQLVTLDTVSKKVSGCKPEEYIVPMEYVAAYQRFYNVNKKAVANGNLPLLYPRSLVRVLREYLSGIRAYNKATFQQTTRKGKVSTTVKGITQVISTLPYMKAANLMKTVNLICAYALAPASLYKWSYRFKPISVAGVTVASKLTPEETYPFDVFLSGADKLVVGTPRPNTYCSEFLSWLNSATTQAQEGIGLQFNIANSTKLSDTDKFMLRWFLNAFIFGFSGIYAYKVTPPNEENSGKTIYKIDGGDNDQSKAFYDSLRRYSSYLGRGTLQIGAMLDIGKIEYSLEYLQKLFMLEYYDRIATHCGRIYGSYVHRNVSGSDIHTIETTNYQASQNTNVIKVFDLDTSSYRIKQTLKTLYAEDSSNVDKLGILENVRIRGINRTYGYSTSMFYEPDVWMIYQQETGLSARQGIVLDDILSVLESYFDKLRPALAQFKEYDMKRCEAEVKEHNDKVNADLVTEKEEVREAMEQVAQAIKQEGTSVNTNGANTINSNAKILADIANRGKDAFDSYTPVELAIFADYLRSTQYKTAFETTNAGLPSKILDTLKSQNFYSVSSKQLYRILQVLEKLIPDFKRDLGV